MKKNYRRVQRIHNARNVLDLAVGVIIGGAFKTIVDSLTNDIIPPILGLFGGLDFSSMVLSIGGVNLKYGSFITAIINFLIMAVVIFIFVKIVNSVISFEKETCRRACYNQSLPILLHRNRHKCDKVSSLYI